MHYPVLCCVRVLELVDGFSDEIHTFYALLNTSQAINDADDAIHDAV